MAYLSSPFPSTAEAGYITLIENLQAEITALRARLEAAEKDAARYEVLGYVEGYHGIIFDHPQTRFSRPVYVKAELAKEGEKK